MEPNLPVYVWANDNHNDQLGKCSKAKQERTPLLGSAHVHRRKPAHIAQRLAAQVLGHEAQHQLTFNCAKRRDTRRDLSKSPWPSRLSRGLNHHASFSGVKSSFFSQKLIWHPRVTWPLITLPCHLNRDVLCSTLDCYMCLLSRSCSPHIARSRTSARLAWIGCGIKSWRVMRVNNQF